MNEGGWCRGRVLGRVVVPRRRGSGRAHYLVQCECGHVKLIDALSWGGNGFYRCPGCGGRVHRLATLAGAPLPPHRRFRKDGGVGSAEGAC